jgi:hypothetical protein
MAVRNINRSAEMGILVISMIKYSENLLYDAVAVETCVLSQPSILEPKFRMRAYRFELWFEQKRPCTKPLNYMYDSVDEGDLQDMRVFLSQTAYGPRR